MAEVTQILASIREGNPSAADELLPMLYQELRRLAGVKLSQEPPGQTLQATALVHEAYLRLIGGEGQDWTSRGHFFCAAAEAMRRILVENARRKHRLKRGGMGQRVDIDPEHLAIEGPTQDVLAVDEALEKLASSDPQSAELIKLRFFAGMTVEEAAAILEISQSSAERRWRFARAWLCGELDGFEK